MPDRILWVSLLLGSMLSLLVCYGIATRSLPLGAPEGGWSYGYVEEFSVPPLGAALLVIGSAAALLLLTPAAFWARRRHESLVVFTWIVAATALHGLLRSVTPATVEEIFLSDAANSFYNVTQRFDIRTVLDHFSDVREKWPLHAQSNMPGKLVLLYGLETLSARTDVLPWLVVAVSNLGGALMYAFVRDLFADTRTALYAAVLYLFVPAKLFFFPLLNTVTPVVVLGCAWLLMRWLRRGTTVDAALFGGALYALVFFEPLPLVMGVLFAALIGGALWSGQATPKPLLVQGIASLVAFATTHAAMSLWFGFDLFSAFRQVGAHALEFNAVSGRPYAFWIRENIREFAFGIGACQAVVFCAALLDGLRGPRDVGTRLRAPIMLVCLSLLMVLLTTNLIGVNRGEVIRLWIFLASFFQIPTAFVCARLRSELAILVVIATSALQAALGTAMIGFVMPV